VFSGLSLISSALRSASDVLFVNLSLFVLRLVFRSSDSGAFFSVSVRGCISNRVRSQRLLSSDLQHYPL